KIQDMNGFLAALYVGLLSFICSLTKVPKDNWQFAYPAGAACAVGILLFFYHYFGGGIFSNNNYAAALVALAVFPYLCRRTRKLCILFFLTAMLLLGARSVLWGVVVAVLLRKTLGYQSSRITKFLSTSVIIIAACSAVYRYQ